jgi:hypothetical protein
MRRDRRREEISREGEKENRWREIGRKGGEIEGVLNRAK